MKKYQEFEINYFQDEDGVFTAQVPAIPGCVAWGQTLEAACQAAVEAIESCLEGRRRLDDAARRFFGRLQDAGLLSGERLDELERLLGQGIVGR